MKTTYSKLIERATIISLFTRRRGPDGKIMPHVAGNLGHPMLAWRVSQALKKLAPVIEEYEGERKALLEAAQTPEEDGGFVLNMEKFNPAHAELLNEEVEVPDFKPLTWKTIEQARLGEDTDSDRAERAEGVRVLPFDASIVLAMGDFLQGEPTEE